MTVTGEAVFRDDVHNKSPSTAFVFTVAKGGRIYKSIIIGSRLLQLFTEFANELVCCSLPSLPGIEMPKLPFDCSQSVRVHRLGQHR